MDALKAILVVLISSTAAQKLDQSHTFIGIFTTFDPSFPSRMYGEGRPGRHVTSQYSYSSIKKFVQFMTHKDEKKVAKKKADLEKKMERKTKRERERKREKERERKRTREQENERKRERENERTREREKERKREREKERTRERENERKRERGEHRRQHRHI